MERGLHVLVPTGSQVLARRAGVRAPGGGGTYMRSAPSGFGDY